MKHFKLKAVGAAVALALCAQANAFVNPADAQVRLYISGATAPSHMIREQTVQNLCDATQDIDVFVDVATVLPETDADGRPLLAHSNHWVVQCVGKDGTPADNQLLLVAKSDPGGSAQGVNPVALGNNRPFLNTALCNIAPTVDEAVAGDALTTYDLRVCGTANVINQVPDMGISDIEPERFVATLNDPGTGDFVTPPPNWQVEVGPGLLFGVVVTTPLRNELQLDQFGAGCVGQETAACMPSLPSWYVSSVFANKIGNWSTEEPYGHVINLPPAPPAFDARVHICRRVQGSGTHAQHMIHFARTNCNRGATVPMPPGGGGIIPGTPVVFENPSSGNVDTCMNVLSSGAGSTTPNPDIPAGRFAYGIGYQSLEKNGNIELNYRFVKIDGVAPTLRNAFNGDYSQVYFLSYNHRENDFRAGAARPVPSPAEAAILEQLIDNSFDINSAIAAQINESFPHPFANAGEGGAFLVPVLPGAAPAAFDPNNPVIPWARRNAANSGPDSCAPLYRR